MNRKRLVVFAAILAVIVLWLGLRWWGSYQTLNISFADNARVETEVYRHDSGSEPIKTVSANASLRLKKGLYVIHTKATDQYASQTLEVTLGNKSEQITVDPSHSQERLATMLEQEMGSIHQAIRQEIALGNNYRLTPGALYKRGEWYGTTIVPNLSDEELRTTYIDAFRVIAHKEDGRWRVVTNPPELIITSPAYPNIPREVLEEVNKQFGAEEDNR